jgi:hypothetical protein
MEGGPLSAFEGPGKILRLVIGELAKRKNNWKSTLSHSPTSELVVKELTPSLRDDFLLFSDHVAFADNPDWSDCYCSPYENPFRS